MPSNGVPDAYERCQGACVVEKDVCPLVHGKRGKKILATESCQETLWGGRSDASWIGRKNHKLSVGGETSRGDVAFVLTKS